MLRYDPQEDSWTMLEPMKRGRSSFALQTINGTLTAIGGWNVSLQDSFYFLSMFKAQK